MTLLDTHSHLYDAAFDADRDECIARDREAGVGVVLLPAIDSQSNAALLALCREYPDYCLPMTGLHPTSVNDNPHWRDELRAVAQALANPEVPRYYGVGEIGLDLYWSRDWEREQTEALETQIELALRYDLPVAVHVRDAWPQTLRVLQSYKGRGLKGVMHAFSGTLDDCRAVKECGDFCFGIGGVSTYKNSHLGEVIPKMSLLDIVLESDAPYLPPVPHRGKRNESGYIVHTCARVASLLGVTPQEVARQTTENAKRIFRI